MKPESVNRLHRATIISCILLSLAVGIVVAAKPDSANRLDTGKRKYWVSRRHETDPDKRGNLALAIRIDYDTGADTTTARIWQYNSVNAGKTEYVPHGTVIVCDCEIEQLGESTNIKREIITLNKDGATLGWITRWNGGKASPGKNKPRQHSRVVFRYSKHFPMNDEGDDEPENSKSSQTKQKIQEVITDPCEEAPDDDILEEESTEIPPDPPMDPPEISYEP